MSWVDRGRAPVRRAPHDWRFRPDVCLSTVVGRANWLTLVALIGSSPLGGVLGRGRPPVIVVAQAAVVIAGVLAVSSFASGALTAWERASKSTPR